MSLIVNSNLMAMSAARGLSNSYGALATSTQRLASGLRTSGAGTGQQASGETVASGSAEQAKGALVNTSDGGSGLVKDLNQAIIDQPDPLQAQSNSLAGHPVAPNMSNSKSVDNAILNLLK